MKYRITKRADHDLREIGDYIAKDNLAAADKLDLLIHHEIRNLAEFPGKGHRRSDVRNRAYLFWVVGNYVIAYRIERETIVVSRVLHGARDFRKLFQS